MVTDETGIINKKASFNVRGEGSINGGEPLVLIDGVEGDMSGNNNDSIESLSIESLSITYMHEVTPSEVPIAVRIVINVWIIIPQMFFFSIAFKFLSLLVFEFVSFFETQIFAD